MDLADSDRLSAWKANQHRKKPTRDWSDQMKPEQVLPSKQSSKVTERINATALELLAKHPEGLRWTDLRKKIEAADASFHPKTVNGCVWKLTEKYPDKVYKPSKGLFRLRKYKSAKK